MAQLREIVEVRAEVMAQVRSFFCQRGYLEVDTPCVVRSPGLDLHLDAFELAGGMGGAPAFLSTSPEYHMKRLLAEGLERIFQIAHCFRRSEIGSRHNPEFLMLEWYRVGCGVEEMMTETEELVRATLTSARVGAHEIDLTQPFKRMTVCEAFLEYGAVTPDQTLQLARHDEEQYFRILIDQVEPALAKCGNPVFLHHYPASQASLARLAPDNPEVCERFELYIGDLELCNGFGELTDADEQRARLEADQLRRADLNKPVYPIDERFLEALRSGLPRCSGNALGLDRLVMLRRDVDALDEAQTFIIHSL